MIIEKEFKKITCKIYYGYVKIDVDLSGDFNFESLVTWLTSMDGEKYEECICIGIKDCPLPTTKSGLKLGTQNEAEKKRLLTGQQKNLNRLI